MYNALMREIREQAALIESINNGDYPGDGDSVEAETEAMMKLYALLTEWQGAQ